MAGLTALLSLLSWFDIFHLVSPWAILDAVLFAIIGLFVSRGSRVAAILSLTLYLFEAMERLIAGSGNSGGASVVVILFTLYFINGVRGAFALARLRQKPDSIEAGVIPNTTVS